MTARPFLVATALFGSFVSSPALAEEPASCRVVVANTKSPASMAAAPCAPQEPASPQEWFALRGAPTEAAPVDVETKDEVETEAEVEDAVVAATETEVASR